MPSPLVTVVIPIYNQARFVVETVGSAVRQTHRDLQVVVVDDGSTDGGAELLAKEFGARITLIRQKNAGPSAAINAGIAAAQGAFIALLGGDDVCVDDRIAVQLEIMRTTSHDIIFSKPLLIDDEGRAMDDATFPVFFRDEAVPTLRTLLIEGNFLCAPSALMRRDAVERVGLFRPGLIQLQDYDYWLRATAAGLSLATLEPRVVQYRRHAANLSGKSANSASIAETVPVIKSVLESGRPEILRAAFPYLFEPVADSRSPLTPFDKALFLLAHPRSEIRMIGIEYAVPLFEDAVFAEKAKKFDLNLLRCVQSAL